MAEPAKMPLLCCAAACVWLLWLISFGVVADAQANVSVLTHHYDAERTGWDRHESVLTPANVPNLKLLKSIPLDEQVDAQPLLVPGLSIAGHGRHDVLYVATENDTIYALDATTGAVLLTRNFGKPVPMKTLPGVCGNNSQVVGIGSTPVIDRATSKLYVMVDTYENGNPIYRLHALSLTTLADTVKPAVVRASAELTTGRIYHFLAQYSRQRAALLEANGNIYAGFASYCDINANLSRGWLLGWHAASLAPLSANRLNNTRAGSPDDFFLSSIWMSGSGVAAAPSGRLYFVTGNSDPSGTSYSRVTNLSESVVEMSPDLTTVEDFFTPSGAGTGVGDLDRADVDFGSGGMLLLPAQKGTTTALAVAAGKAGSMYLFNRRHLGRYDSTGANHVLGTFNIGPCWCAETYYTGSDGIGRIVSSGGASIIVWKVQTAPTLTLKQESQSTQFAPSILDSGFFTTVSSNGTTNPIIWAVGRPKNQAPANVTLYAFDPVAAAQGHTAPIFSGVAGTWPNPNANSNIVPVVANGLVYVASYKHLAIFGRPSAQAATQRTPRLTDVAPPAALPLPPGGHEIYGVIKSVESGHLTVSTRAGAPVRVDATEAIQNYQSITPLVGEPVRLLGRYDGSHVLHATSIIHAKPSPQGWPADR